MAKVVHESKAYMEPRKAGARRRGKRADGRFFHLIQRMNN